MAACLITISGTGGKVLLKYKESTVDKSATLDIGTIYLNDATVTDVTYTTLIGDAIATSGCFTITELPTECYKISWDFNDLEDYSFVSVTIDEEVIDFDDVVFPNSKFGLAIAINSLLDDRIKVVQGLLDVSVTPMNTTMIIKVLSSTPPIFKIQGPGSSDTIYLIGEVASCSNVGYTNFKTCQDIIELP